MTLLTDTEAREQLCPHMTHCWNESQVAQDKTPAIYVQCMCQGSDCKMAWRWAMPYKKDYEYHRLSYYKLTKTPKITV